MHAATSEGKAEPAAVPGAAVVALPTMGCPARATLRSVTPSNDVPVARKAASAVQGAPVLSAVWIVFACPAVPE